MTPTTKNDFETVALFIDGERVDPMALKGALSTDEGRDYLVELVAMREVIAGPASVAPSSVAIPARSSSWRGLAAAAVITIGVGIGGYAMGVAERRNADKAPTPTVTVTAAQGWQEVKGGN